MAVDEVRDKLYGRAAKKSFFRRAIDLLRWNFGNIYFLGQGFDSLVSKVERGTFAGYDIESPLHSTINETVDAIAEGVRSIKFAVSGEIYR